MVVEEQQRDLELRIRRSILAAEKWLSKDGMLSFG